MNSFRGGMQVHAVPEEERATDSRGQQLPWGYSYSDASLNRKQPVERGPFGRPTSRRATSRSKTGTPGPKDDPANLENLKTIDEIFGKFKKEQGEKENKPPREQRPSVVGSRTQQTQPAADSSVPIPAAPPGGQAGAFKEPTEILIYGYSSEQLSEALEFYESASLGRIYEDYDRSPPTPRYGALLHQVRASLPRSLPPAVRRKINTYSGGDHWIKVTFDSPEAAERACFFSPTTLHGFSIHAEPWRGVGPSADAPIYANLGGQSGAKTMKQRRPMQPGQRDPFSSLPGRMQSAPGPNHHGLNNGSPDTSETLSTATTTATANGVRAISPLGQGEATASGVQAEDKPLRIRGARRAVLRPHTEAFLPVPPWSQRTFGHVPLIGALFGGDPNAKPGQGGGIIGNAVPRKDDGAFDWNNASTYWRVCWWVDYWFGTDLCGMKGDD